MWFGVHSKPVFVLLKNSSGAAVPSWEERSSGQEHANGLTGETGAAGGCGVSVSLSALKQKSGSRILSFSWAESPWLSVTCQQVVTKGGLIPHENQDLPWLCAFTASTWWLQTLLNPLERTSLKTHLQSAHRLRSWGQREHQMGSGDSYRQ